MAPSVNPVALPTHTDDAPDMLPASGNGLTVNVCVAAAVPQPLVTVYDIVVVPAAMPVTLPEASKVANDVAVLLHVPPVATSVSGVLLAAHTVDAPDMVPASGNGLTVNVCVAAAVPQLLVTA